MTKIKTIYDVTISLLTPLHIGNGREMLNEYDYVIHNNQTWVMDADRFLEDIYWQDGNPDERILGRPASELLTADDFRKGSDYFRYVLQGAPRSRQSGAVLVEQIKDIHDHPYLPGTSIKGALRTLLAWHGFTERNQKLDVRELRGSPRWAGQTLERNIFGRDPNHDLLRALQVADAHIDLPKPKEGESPANPAEGPTSRFQIINAQVVTGSEKMGAPIEMEAIRSDTSFTTTFTLDDYLNTNPAASEKLRFGRRWSWLTDLPQIAQRHALERMKSEQAWYQDRKYNNVAGFYGQMVQILQGNQLGSSRFLVQIGWGGGWDSKTIGQPLQQDQSEWERLLGHKRLSPARFRRKPGDRFPKSRRAVVPPVKQGKPQPAAPFGWCLVEMKERE